ncbi:MAG: prepilin-type N-terminal cleavage/methylation domain-containing protein [Gammaproteobacteria bacterium]|nr:prepilin-type N-terminal cleavage/methylation domain-containing protein [Gammaproteobacteria bacterium]
MRRPAKCAPAAAEQHALTRGFSMLELVMVIAVIAIIASLAIPSQIGAVTQKRIIESLELLEPYKPQIEAYYFSHGGSFPKDNAEASLPEPDKLIGKYIRKVDLRDGVMHMYLGRDMPEALHNKIISIRPIFVKDSPQSPVSWVCGYDAIPDGLTGAGKNLTDIEKAHLPGRCR